MALPILLIIFSLSDLYILLYSMIEISSRYKQLAVSEDIFESVQELKQDYQGTTSDILAAAINSMKREIARRNGARAVAPQQ